MQLAMKYYNDTQYDKAMTEIDKVLETSPDYDIALYYKALCYLGTEDEDKAKEAFDTFIQKCPNSIYYTVAVALSGADTMSGTPDDGDGTTEGSSEGTTESGMDPTNE